MMIPNGTRVPHRALVYDASLPARFLQARILWDTNRIAALREYLMLFNLMLNQLDPIGDGRMAIPIAELSAALGDIDAGNSLPEWISPKKRPHQRPRSSTVISMWRATVVAGISHYPHEMRSVGIAEIAEALRISPKTAKAWWDRYDRGIPEPSADEKRMVDDILGFLVEVSASPAEVPSYLQEWMAGRERPPERSQRQARRHKAQPPEM